MANSYGTNPIVLDDFSAAIDVGDSVYGKGKTQFQLDSIEWVAPTTVAHTAVITDYDGNTIFSAKCSTANAEVQKYFDGLVVRGIKIAASGVGSGKIIITLK